MPGRWSIMLSIARSDTPAAEDFSVVVADRVLTVRVRRHHASRRYRLRYDQRSGELRLTLPLRQRIAPARQWVADQGAWIAQQIVARPVSGTMVAAGTRLPWDGGWLTIQWSPDHPRQPVIDADCLRLGGPTTAIAPRVRRWLQQVARREFGERSRTMAEAENLPLRSVSVGDPRSRWGSCSASGAIRYSWRLAMAPEFVRHAIVAHEVAHLAHMNHGPRFHALADQLGGAANAQSKAWLKAHGMMLHALNFDS